MAATRVIRELRDLDDVDSSALADGSTLVYDQAVGEHVYEPLGTAGPVALTDLTDVSGTPGDRKSPVYDPAGTLALLTEIFTQDDIGTILAAVAATNWQPLQLAAGVTNNDGYVPGRYRLTLNNTVYLEGVLSCVPPLTEGDSGRPIATLPAECNPGYTLIFSCPATGQNPVELRVNPDGSIVYQSHFYGTGEADLITLCGINYSVDQGTVVADAIAAALA